MGDSYRVSDVNIDTSKIKDGHSKMKRMIEQNQKISEKVKYEDAKKKMSLKEMIKTPIGISIVLFFISMLILFVINPPITQKKNDTKLVEGEQSISKMIVFSSFVGVASFFVTTLVIK